MQEQGPDLLANKPRPECGTSPGLTPMDRFSMRAKETSDLLQPVLAQLLEFITSADEELQIHLAQATLPSSGTSLIGSTLSSDALLAQIKSSLALEEHGYGSDGLIGTVKDILSHSINPSAPGFLDKLYASPLPPGIAAELVLAVLNTNVHVYQVSPVLTLIEKRVTKALAIRFGLIGPRAGGINVQGGSASNLTSIVAARNSLFPETKMHGNGVGHAGNLLLFTSAHGHYSIEKAAQALGFGSRNVIAVPVDDEGRMIVAELARLIEYAIQSGDTPFYINATAGSTVLGSFDPFQEIAVIARKYRCWLHVDGAWGGSFIFANRENIRQSFRGISEADSIAINPHKMLGVPLTCSFLLIRDLRLLERAMTLRAGYLFHEADIEDDNDTRRTKWSSMPDEQRQHDDEDEDDSLWSEPDDLADLTLQCGRRGDSLKFFLSWQYYGSSGYRQMVETAHDIAIHLSLLVNAHDDLQLALGHDWKPQCLQVCFYFTPSGHHVFGTRSSKGKLKMPELPKDNSKTLSNDAVDNLRGRYNTMVTSRMVRALVERGFMIDYAPALTGQEDRGSFFRVVINISTVKATVERLVTDLVEVGNLVVGTLESKYH